MHGHRRRRASADDEGEVAPRKSQNDGSGGEAPVVGDAFDVAWRSNRRNLEIIEQDKSDPEKEPTALDYVLVGTGFTLAALSVLMPIFIVYGVGLGALLGLGSLFG